MNEGLESQLQLIYKTTVESIDEMGAEDQFWFACAYEMVNAFHQYSLETHDVSASDFQDVLFLSTVLLEKSKLITPSDTFEMDFAGLDIDITGSIGSEQVN